MAKKFNEGDKVRIYDEVYGWVKGYVTDTTVVSVFVQWNDCSEPVEHPLSHQINNSISKKELADNMLSKK